MNNQVHGRLSMDNQQERVEARKALAACSARPWMSACETDAYNGCRTRAAEQDKEIQRLKELLVAANKDSWSEVVKRIDES